MTLEEARKIVFHGLDRVNADLPSEMHLKKQEATILLGEGSQIDSLGLFILLSAIDDALNEQFGLSDILGDDVIAASDSPLRTVETLINHITEASQ